MNAVDSRESLADDGLEAIAATVYLYQQLICWPQQVWNEYARNPSLDTHFRVPRYFH